MKEINDIKEILANCIDAGGIIDEKDKIELEQILKDVDEEFDEKSFSLLSMERRTIELEHEIEEITEKFDQSNASNSFLPCITLQDANKNKILINLHHNCTEEQLENIQKSAITAIQNKGILYKEL